jgi:hypothetical protein
VMGVSLVLTTEMASTARIRRAIELNLAIW